MEKIRIITDSAADFEPFELEKWNIACIPLKVMLGDTEYEENQNLSKDQFFSLLASTGDTPTTGDTTLFALGALMVLSTAAVVLLKKKEF